MVHDTQSSQHVQSKERDTCIVTSWRQSHAPILLITTMALWPHAGYRRPVAGFIAVHSRHWPSIAGMSQQSHCGDEEDGHIWLSSWRHYIYIYIYIYMYIYICIIYIYIYWFNIYVHTYTHTHTHTHIYIIYIYIFQKNGKP